MIKKHCFTREWFQSVAKSYGYGDTGIIEKVIRAYSLLDMLSRSGCPFIFKGGSAASLILGGRTNRLSIDIDVICPPGTDMEPYLTECADYGFLRTELVERRQAGNDVPKSHSKFFYQIAYTDRTDRESFILLDVLYEYSHYEQVDTIAVQSPFFELDGEPSVVRVPSVGDILGDKLTAFAPNTTGIPYYKNGKPHTTEIMKQVYDIGRLFDAVDDLAVTAKSFHRIAMTELGYRGLAKDVEQIYDDILQTSLLLATRGMEGTGDFPLLQDGLKRFGSFVYQGKYYIEDAIADAAKAAYLAVCLRHGVNKIEKFGASSLLPDTLAVRQPLSTRLNKLKRTNPTAFHYWAKISEILSNNQI